MLEQVVKELAQMREDSQSDRLDTRNILQQELVRLYERLNKTATKDDLMQYVRVDVFEAHRAHESSLVLDQSARSLRLETKVETITDKLHAAEISSATRGEDKQERLDARTLMFLWMGFSLVVSPLIGALINYLIHH